MRTYISFTNERFAHFALYIIIMYNGKHKSNSSFLDDSFERFPLRSPDEVFFPVLLIYAGTIL